MSKILGFLFLISILFVLNLFFINLGWNLFVVEFFQTRELTNFELAGLAILISCTKNYNGGSK